MGFPFVGIRDAASIERALRDGHPIYLEDGIGSVYVLFAGGEFRVQSVLTDEILFRSPAFIELAAWVAFNGRDIL